jgi:hypothetical protein
VKQSDTIVDELVISVNGAGKASSAVNVKEYPEKSASDPPELILPAVKSAPLNKPIKKN